jgi:hypothetical protein
MVFEPFSRPDKRFEMAAESRHDQLNRDVVADQGHGRASQAEACGYKQPRIVAG